MRRDLASNSALLNTNVAHRYKSIHRFLVRFLTIFYPNCLTKPLYHSKLKLPLRTSAEAASEPRKACSFHDRSLLTQLPLFPISSHARGSTCHTIITGTLTSRWQKSGRTSFRNFHENYKRGRERKREGCERSNILTRWLLRHPYSDDNKVSDRATSSIFRWRLFVYLRRIVASIWKDLPQEVIKLLNCYKSNTKIIY